MSLYNTRFITIEGVDGAGKTTHVSSLVQQLRNAGLEVVHTREPGGTPLAENIRDLVLNTPMDPETETLLMFSARADHLQRVILPALAQGKVVVCDRFTDSSWAYQGGGKQVSRETLSRLEDIVHPHLQPGLTLLFDLPIEESMRRLAGTGKTPDQFESLPREVFERIRQAYLDRAAAQPQRFAIINANQSVERMASDVAQLASAYVDRHFAPKLSKARP